MAPVSILASLSLCLAAVNGFAVKRQATACAELESRFPGTVFYPEEDLYETEILDYYSLSCSERSTCLFEPEDANQISEALGIFQESDTQFAVRGAGHMPIPGANGITEGVLLSMARFQTREYNEDKSILKLGPGWRWEDIYNFVSESDLAVAGGRYGSVGVPGLLLGGGISVFGGTVGWAVNNVVNFEVVLANGTIVNANENENSDLWWALKGGSSNFGVVTRFDVKTFEFTDVWGGTTIHNKSQVDEYINAYAHYNVKEGGSSDPFLHVNPSILVNITSDEVTLFSLLTRQGNVSNPPSTSNFTAIPNVSTNNSQRQKLNGISNETEGDVYAARSTRRIFACTAVQSAVESILIVNSTFFDSIAADSRLKSVLNMTVGVTLNTMSADFIQAAKDSGGDPIGLEDSNGSGVGIILYSAEWDLAQDDPVVEDFMEKLIASLDQNLDEKNLRYDHRYLNDAANFQKDIVFQSYGTNGDSLARMRTIATSYDPDGVFQTLQPGGFKLW